MNSACPAPSHVSSVERTRLRNLAIAILVLSLLALRIFLWRYIDSGDLLHYFLPLQDFLIEHGRWHTLHRPLADYFPAYYEVAILTSYLDGHFNRISQIKLVSFCFDLVAAGAAYLLVGCITQSRKFGRRICPAQLIAPFCILAGPTVLLDGSIWGQCDIVFTSFLLLSTYAVLADSGAMAALLFGFALSFKLQSIFLAPFLCAMLLQRRIRWVHLLLVPVGWLVALIPPLLNGANAWAYLKLPFVQSAEYPSLSLNAANPWAIAQYSGLSLHSGTLIGLVLTLCTFAALAAWGSHPAFRSRTNTLMLAALSVLAMPYVMPRMHDRYFFVADVFLSVLSCVDLAFVLPAALVICASLIVYTNYFVYHLRFASLVVALLANTIALLLVLEQAMLRTRADAHTDVTE